MNHRILIGGLIAVATVSSLAIAAEKIIYQREGEITQTSTSGEKSSSGKYFGVPAINRALTGLSMWEMSDKACTYAPQFRELHHMQKEDEWGDPRRLCSRSSDGNGKKTISLGWPDYVEGIQICTTQAKESSKTRLKGVKLYGARVDSSGKVVSGSSTAKFERSNCNGNWRSKVMCPKGEVAWAITMYQGDSGYNGVSLRCQAVKQKKTITR